MRAIPRFILILLSAFAVSCSHNLDVNEILYKENELHLRVGFTLDSTKFITISKDSKKFNELTDWFAKNSEGWKSSPASWATPDIFLWGDDFRLLVFSDGAVIGFTDGKGKQKQYTKQVNKSEFNFLLIKY
jgi:alpha-tubulin suppressor-like RCC1 family protein